MTKNTMISLSPDNKDLMSYLKPFIGSNNKQPHLSGVYFAENEVVSTDKHKAIIIKGKSDYDGIYSISGEKIEGHYIDYSKLLAEYKSFDNIEVNVNDLLILLNKALKYADREEHIVSLFPTRKRLFIRAEDTMSEIVNLSNMDCEYTGKPSMITLNAKFLIELLSLCRKDGIDSVRIKTAPNSQNLFIDYYGIFGSTKLILAKSTDHVVMYETDYKGNKKARLIKEVTQKEIFPEYMDRFNEDLPSQLEHGISPYNPDLMSLLSAFTYKHELSEGAVLFKTEGVVASDLEKAIFIEGSPSRLGTFSSEGISVKKEIMNDINTDFDKRIDFKITVNYVSFRQALSELELSHKEKYITLLPMITKLLATTKPYRNELLQIGDFQEMSLDKYYYSGSCYPMRYRFDHLQELMQIIGDRSTTNYRLASTIEISFIKMGGYSPDYVRGLLVRFPSKLGLINILLIPQNLMEREFGEFSKTYITSYKKLFYEDFINKISSFKSILAEL